MRWRRWRLSDGEDAIKGIKRRTRCIVGAEKERAKKHEECTSVEAVLLRAVSFTRNALLFSLVSASLALHMHACECEVMTKRQMQAPRYVFFVLRVRFDSFVLFLFVAVVVSHDPTRALHIRPDPHPETNQTKKVGKQ